MSKLFATPVIDVWLLSRKSPVSAHTVIDKNKVFKLKQNAGNSKKIDSNENLLFFVWQMLFVNCHIIAY